MKKYYFGKLSVFADVVEVETSFLFVKEGGKSIQKAVDNFEENFYSDAEYNEESDMYELQMGDASYTGVTYNEITKEEYDVMSKHLITHSL